MWQLIAAIATGIIGLGAYWLKSLRELKLKYDAELRDARLERYRGLWAALKPLAKHGRRSDKTLSRADAEKLIAILQTWYFHTGGLYLSVDARNAYDALLTALTAVAAQRWGSTDPNDGQLDKPTFDALRVRGSHLRSNMSRDVGTRKRFMLRWDGAPIHVAKVEGNYTSTEPDESLNLSFPRWRRPWRRGRVHRAFPRLRRRSLPRSVGSPTLTLNKTPLNTTWDPWLWTLTAEIDRADCDFILEEEGKVVQTPCDASLDWRDPPPPPAKVWHRQPATSRPEGREPAAAPSAHAPVQDVDPGDRPGPGARLASGAATSPQKPHQM
jgi:hypothetical protein